MAKPSEFDLKLGRSVQSSGVQRRQDGAPARILVMGDFGGSRAESSAGRLIDRRPVRVDIDRLDDVFTLLAPEVRWPGFGGQGESQTMKLRSIDDFHPDHLYRCLPLFEPLRNAKKLIQRDRDSVEAVADLLRDAGLLIDAGGPAGGAAEPPAPPNPPAAAGQDLSEDADADVLHRLLGARPASLGEAPPSVDISSLLKQAVEGHVVPAASARQQLVVDSIDLAMNQLMRFLLHDGAFQSLESNWRLVHRIVSQIDMDETVELFLLDLSQQYLVTDLAAENDWRGTELHRWMIEAAQVAWSLLVGAYTFGHSTTDIATLAMVGGIAAEAGCPFLGGADATLLGCGSWIEAASPRDWASDDDVSLQAWQTLRTSGLARWIGLAAPRVLVRLPYGSRTDPIDSFDLEELASHEEHDHFLWGNPGLALAELALMAWTQKLSLGEALMVDDLPAFTYTGPQGEPEMKPCAELLLSDRTAEALLERGIMPLVSQARGNQARLLRFQSIARPAAPLANV